MSVVQVEDVPVVAPESLAAAAVPQDGVSVGPSDAAAAPVRPSPGGDSAVLKCKGLPYSTTEAELLTFFKDFAVKRVAFVMEPDGRPSGLAFAEFETKDDAMKALTKNGDYLGERYVRLLHVPKSEMEEQVRLGTLAIPGAAAKLRSRLMRQQAAQRNNLAYLSAAGPLQLLPTALPSAGGARGHPHPLVAATLGPSPYSGGNLAGGLPLDARLWPNYQNQLAAQFGGVSMAPGAQHSLGMGMGMSMGLGHHGRAAGLMQGQPGGMPPGVAGSGAGAAGPAAGLPSAQILSNTRTIQNPTSSTVKVRGLPYRSSPAEILAFFQGYQYLPDSLQIGLDSLGRPSGEAWLTFVTPAEALRAVRDLNRHYLGNRYLELSIC